MTSRHFDMMSLAARAAARHLGMTGDNPSVGAVIVKDGYVLGIGATSPTGRPHAEMNALAQAGAAAKGADIYVTLEPCAHHGRSGPCADALIAAGIARVFCAWQDPNPLVAGRGFAKLHAAGVEVVAIDHMPSFSTLAPFFTRMSLKRPRFLVKLATSIDGKIATNTGSSQWISNPAARQYGQNLRLKSDGILIGIGTALADDPALTVRRKGFEHYSPRPIVLDSEARLPSEAKLRAHPDGALLATTKDINDVGAKVLTIARSAHGGVDVKMLAEKLAGEGLNSVMIEGGGRVIASFLRAGLVDEFVHITGAKAIGGDGIAGLASIGVDDISDAPQFELRALTRFESDIVSHYEPKTPALNASDFFASNAL